MTEFPVFGRRDDPEAIPHDPLLVPLAGYTADGKEVVETFHFRPTEALGAAMEILHQGDAQGNVGFRPVSAYLDRAVTPDDREAWHAFLDRDDLTIEGSALLRIFEALTAHYAGRPTQLRSGSANGRARTRGTSVAGPRSTASTSRRSPRK